MPESLVARHNGIGLGLVLALLVGCGEYEMRPPKADRQAAERKQAADSNPAPAAASNADAKPGEKSPAPADGQKPSGSEKDKAGPDASKGANDNARPAEKAAVGVGEKGRGYGQGYVAASVAALFATKERLVFEVQIPKAMDAYKGINGKGPKDHEAFMKDIIEVDQIRLPELPAGRRYLYDPVREELTVVDGKQ